MAAGGNVRGKSGLQKARCRVTPGGGNPRDSATENRQLWSHLWCAFVTAKVMVKRWGKSPPRERQRKRHGKPHREQCQIGTARRKAGGLEPEQSGLAARDRLVTGGLDEWSSIWGNPKDKIRLIGRPRIFIPDFDRFAVDSGRGWRKRQLQ